MKRKFLALMLISTMTITCAACGSKSASNSADSTSKFASEISSVSKTDSNDNKTTDGAAIKESASTAADNDTSAVSYENRENSDNNSAEIAPASIQNISSDNSNGNAGNNSNSNSNADAGSNTDTDSNNSSSSNADTGSNAGNNSSGSSSSDSHVNNNNSYVNNVNSDSSASNRASHTHSWDDGTVTAQPACTEEGTRTYSCSCGATRTESIPALNHNMVHHDATTHSEQKVVKEGYYTHEEYYVCNGCGARFATDDEAGEHIMADDYWNSVDDYYFDDCSNYSLEYSYTYHEPEYETVEVSDNNAYDECSRCGYRQ